MHFGERKFTNPQKIGPQQFRRQLLPLGLLLAIGMMVLVMRGFRWGSEAEPSSPEPAPSEDSGPDGSPVAIRIENPIVDDVAPPEPTPPEPWAEDPLVLAEAASYDRTGVPHDGGIVHLIQRMRWDPEAIRSEPVLTLDRKDDDVWRQLLADPSRYRGQLIEIKGYVVATEPNSFPLRLHGLEAPNPSGLDRCYRSYAIGTDDRYYLVFTFDKAKELRDRDRVRLRGFFLQLYTGDVVHRGELRKATIPVLVGTDYSSLVTPKVATPDPSVYIPIVLALGAIAFLIVFGVNRRGGGAGAKRDRAGRAKRLERRGSEVGSETRIGSARDEAANGGAPPALGSEES